MSCGSSDSGHNVRRNLRRLFTNADRLGPKGNLECRRAHTTTSTASSSDSPNRQTHTMTDSDAPFRSSSLLPQKRTRRSSHSQDAPPPRRAKSVSDVRLRPTLLASAASVSSSSKLKANGKGKTKATEVPPTSTLGAEAEGWKGDMFGRFVEKALRDVEDYGDTTTYDDLVSQLRPAVPDPNAPSSSSSSAHPALIHPLLVGLTTHASLLSSTTHRTLIQALIHFPWSTADEGFVETYMRFMGVLVSLRMEWLGEVVKRCVKGFQYRASRPYFAVTRLARTLD